MGFCIFVLGKGKEQMRLKSSGDRDRGGYPAVRYERGVVAESPTLCVGLREGKGIAIYNSQSEMLLVGVQTSPEYKNSKAKKQFDEIDKILKNDE